MHTTLSCLLMSFHYICVRPMSKRANNGFERFSFKMHMKLINVWNFPYRFYR